MYFLNIILACFLAFSTYNLLHGPNGYDKYLETEKKLSVSKTTTQNMQERNDNMRAEIDNLKANDKFDAVEDLARSNLGYIKPGEKFYRVIEPESGMDNDEQD